MYKSVNGTEWGPCPFADLALSVGAFKVEGPST